MKKVFEGLKYSDYFNVALCQMGFKGRYYKTYYLSLSVDIHTPLFYLTYDVKLIFTVSKLLGHKDIKTTQIYGKIIDKKKREAVNKLPQIKI